MEVKIFSETQKGNTSFIIFLKPSLSQKPTDALPHGLVTRKQLWCSERSKFPAHLCLRTMEDVLREISVSVIVRRALTTLLL